MLAVMRRNEQRGEVNTTNTREWREAVRAELERRGRGAQAEMARALGVNSGQISDTLRETGEPDERRHSKYRPQIDAYLAQSRPPDPVPSVTRDTSELAYLLEGIAEIDRELLRVLREMTRDEQLAWLKALRQLRGK